MEEVGLGKRLLNRNGNTLKAELEKNVELTNGVSFNDMVDSFSLLVC